MDQAPDEGDRAYWFEGFRPRLDNEDIPVPESATVAVTRTKRVIASVLPFLKQVAN